jgi:hypothetical protein
MRQVQYNRIAQALTASQFLYPVPLKWDRITGAQGVVKMRLSVPAADANTVEFFFQVGNQIQIMQGIVPVEEFAGAGPNLRQPPFTVWGSRGDQIIVGLRETSATTATVTIHMEIANIGR